MVISRVVMILIIQAEAVITPAERMSPRLEDIAKAEATTLKRHRAIAEDAKIVPRANTPPKGAQEAALQTVTVTLDAIARAGAAIGIAMVDLQVTRIKSVMSTSVKKHSNAVSRRQSVRLRKLSAMTVRSLLRGST